MGVFGIGKKSEKDEGMKQRPTASATKVKDPVCGMDVDPKTAAGKSDYQGKTYYFCNPSCKESFDKEPHRYLSSDKSNHGAAQ